MNYSETPKSCHEPGEGGDMETCGTCKYADNHDGWGACRANPPAVVAARTEDGGIYESFRPDVYSSDPACRHYVKREDEDGMDKR